MSRGQKNISVLQVLNSTHTEGEGEPLCYSKTLLISRPHTSNIPTNRTEKEGEEKHLNLRGVVSPASCAQSLQRSSLLKAAKLDSSRPCALLLMTYPERHTKTRCPHLKSPVGR